MFEQCIRVVRAEWRRRATLFFFFISSTTLALRTSNSNAVCTVYDCVRVNYNGSEIYRFDSIGRLFAAEYQLFCRQLLAALKLLFECL